MRRSLSLFLSLLSVSALISCGKTPLILREPAVVKSVGAKIVGPLGVAKFGSVLHIQPFDGRSFIVVSKDDSSNIVLTRCYIDSQMKWTVKIPADNETTIDRSGIHMQSAIMYLPIYHKTADFAAERKYYAIDVVTGMVSPSIPIMRMNNGDEPSSFAGFEDRSLIFETPVGSSVTTSRLGESKAARTWGYSIYSPDSSKLFTYKTYAVGSDRMGMELLLFKRGYSLIYKQTIEFKLDKPRQQFLGALTDNDGVIYIFLADTARRNFEVGRYELLGGTRVRPMRFSLPDSIMSRPVQGELGVSPRGHAYLSLLEAAEENARIGLIDFDFYHDTAILATTPLLGDPDAEDIISATLMTRGITVAADEDRIMIPYDLGATRYAAAFSLEGRPVWSEKLFAAELPYTNTSVTSPYRGELGLWQVMGDTLRYGAVSLVDGRITRESFRDALAFVHGDLRLFRAVYLNPRTMVTLDPVYVITRP